MSTAFAQVPAGPEFRVNTFTTGHQRLPSAVADSQGRFVIAWPSFDQDGSLTGVFAQRYDPAGRPQAAEFRVNSYTPGREYGQALAIDGGGRFTAAWFSTQDGDSYGVMAQRFEPSGMPLGGEFQVNSYTTGPQGLPSVAADAAGNFVVAWGSYNQDDPYSGDIFAQRYDQGGARRGAEFQVNTFTSSLQVLASVAASAAGDFVVVWQSYAQDGDRFGVFGQRFDGSGARRGGEFRVNTTTSSDQGFADVASDPAGNFVVAWGTNTSVWAQRFDAAGARLAGEFQVNTNTGFQGDARVAFDSLGNFIVTWDGNDPGSISSVFGRRYTAGGVPRGPQFRVNTYTTGDQVFPGVASDDVGNFVVAWMSDDQQGDSDQDGSGAGVFAQRFGGLRPEALTVDTGIWEPGETVALRPTWRNRAGGPRTFAATLSNLTGPAGATYTLTDATGNYGTVPDDGIAPCTDCYGVAVSAWSARPTHWDAEVVESITPDVLGQQKKWRLHIGASFPDVPPASAFYHSVETLLHHSVTGGCAGGLFCPGGSTTREQMAVFVLVAREGALYRPPACGTPRFGDVPATSSFCPWIEELARRGVVSGCGGNFYCPGSPVTREQMAVLLLRTLDPALDPPACAPPNVFNDVPESSPFCRWIEEMVARGITGGCGGGAYCPTAPVTREQMAVFVTTAFNLQLYGP